MGGRAGGGASGGMGSRSRGGGSSFGGYSVVNRILQGKTSSSGSSTKSTKSSTKKSEPRYTSTGHRIGMKTSSPKSNASNWNNWQWKGRK